LTVADDTISAPARRLERERQNPAITMLAECAGTPWRRWSGSNLATTTHS
jgi:hypothetical protein